jgi:hypothetical protein
MYKEISMKKVIFGLLAFSITCSALADWDCRNGVDHRHSSCYRPYRPNVIVQNSPTVFDAAMPMIIGGVIGYAISNNQQRQVVEQQTLPNCGPWTETQNADGTITRTRTCNR